MYNSRIELNYINKPLLRSQSQTHNMFLLSSPTQHSCPDQAFFFPSFSPSQGSKNHEFSSKELQLNHQRIMNSVPRILTNKRMKRQQKIIKFQEKATYHYM